MAEKQNQQSTMARPQAAPEVPEHQTSKTSSSEIGKPRERDLSRYGGGQSNTLSFMRKMMDDMDRLFESLVFGGGGGRASDLESIGAWTPEIEMFEREGKLVVRADLPGTKKGDVHVSIDDDSIVIEGERREEHEEKREGLYRSERSYGSFQRRLALPQGVDASSAEANFENGVLEITVPMPKASRRQLEIRGGELHH